MEISNLVIEVTRKCNMACPHCLRGDAEKISFDYKMLPNVFSGIDYIDTITFTGGEITVALPTFEKIVDYICTRNIQFENFYIKTNLKKVSKKFLLLVDMLYQKAEYNDISNLDFSFDIYHDSDEFINNYWRYKDFQEELCLADYITNLNVNKKPLEYKLIYEGNATKWFSFEDSYRKPSFFNGFFKEDDDCFCENIVYVAANGNVISDCNLSYEHIDEYAFGNNNSLYKTLKVPITDDCTMKDFWELVNSDVTVVKYIIDILFVNPQICEFFNITEKQVRYYYSCIKNDFSEFIENPFDISKN